MEVTYSESRLMSTMEMFNTSNKEGLCHFSRSLVGVGGGCSLRFMPLGTSETIKNYISGNCNE